MAKRRSSRSTGSKQRLERHLATLLSAWPGVPMPSLRVIQAPVFHGHSFSIWIEFEKFPGVEGYRSALAPRESMSARTSLPPMLGIAGHQRAERRGHRSVTETMPAPLVLDGGG